MNATDDFDFFVIGAGSGGVRASRIAASLGAKVGVCESGALGGTCVNIGCVPKKLMVYASHFGAAASEAAGFGWNLESHGHDWSKLIANKDREITRLNGVYQRLLEGRGVKILRGRGSLVSPGELDVEAADGGVTRVRAKNILVATGGRPSRPTIPGAEHIFVSDDIFYLKAMPKRLLVIGGGYIAVEFAGVFKGLGAEVTLAYRGALFLRGFDRDVRSHLGAEMRKHGIDLRFHRDLVRVDKTADGSLRCTFDDDSTMEVDAVLAAIGRVPNTERLGLERVGVQTDERGAIRVDAEFRTSTAGVYAVGDVIDRVQLTPVALAEGMIVAQNLFSNAGKRADYDAIPSAVFSDPPIGTVGLSEEEARAELGAVDVYKSTFTPMMHTMTGHDVKTFMKLVVHRSTRRVVGVHMVGPEAGEIIQGFAVALKCGATKEQFDATIGIHPTAAEEFVTMREVSVTSDDATEYPDAPHTKKVVHHRWEDEGAC